MSRKRRHDSDGGSSGSGWMTTYSDLVTLLLTFFILLYTFSVVDAEKFKAVAASLQFALTGQSGTSIFEDNPPSLDKPIEEFIPAPENEKEDLIDPVENNDGSGLLDKEIDRIYKIVQDFVSEEGLEAEVRLRTDRRGVIIDISDSVLFDPGKADLKLDSKELLDKLTKLINSFDNNIIVEGHTDNVPIKRSKFPTNWELSVNRATTVIRYFIEKRNIAPNRLSAAGYGEYKPLVPNDTAEHKTMNRRVNILIEASLERGIDDDPNIPAEN